MHQGCGIEHDRADSGTARVGHVGRGVPRISKPSPRSRSTRTHPCLVANWGSIPSMPWRSRWPFPGATVSSCGRTIRTIGRSSPACAGCRQHIEQHPPGEHVVVVTRRCGAGCHATASRGGVMESRLTSSPAVVNPCRWPAGPLLLAYPVLVVAGSLTQRQIFPLLALVLLVTAGVTAEICGAGACAVAGVVAAQALWLLALALPVSADLLLKAVPVLINALLAWWFGRSLRRCRPLVARCIVAIEGAARLRRAAAWRVTRASSPVLGRVDGGAGAGCWPCCWLVPRAAGVLAQFGIDAAAARRPVGGLGPGCTWAAMSCSAWCSCCEYPCRRWRLRHLRHPGLPQMLLRTGGQLAALVARAEARRRHDGELPATRRCAASTRRIRRCPGISRAAAGTGRDVAGAGGAGAARVARGSAWHACWRPSSSRPLLPDAAGAGAPDCNWPRGRACVSRLQRDGSVLARGVVEGAA